MPTRYRVPGANRTTRLSAQTSRGIINFSAKPKVFLTPPSDPAKFALLCRFGEHDYVRLIKERQVWCTPVGRADCDVFQVSLKKTIASQPSGAAVLGVWRLR